MAAMKFGATGNPALTWAMNVHVPAIVAETFAASRIVAFSTGCVYPFVPVASGGATEEMPAVPPPGDYANSCVGRERMFEHFSARLGTPGRIVRLNYAIDMRYGVLHDIATKVRDGSRNRSVDGPRQRHLAGRCQCGGAALPRARNHADHAHQRHGAGDDLRALAGRGVRPALRPRAQAHRQRRRRRGLAQQRRAHGGRVRAARASPLRAHDRLDCRLARCAACASHGKPTHYEVRDGRF